MSEEERQTQLIEQILAVQNQQLKFLQERERAYKKIAIVITVVVLLISVAVVVAVPFLEKL